LGDTAALGLLPDYGEHTRQGLERLLATGVSGRDLDEWEHTVDVYGVEIGAAAPTVIRRCGSDGDAAAPCVYVDRDPIVLVHARALLAGARAPS
jgi:hypothetical protein